ncbi:MAG: hypothetical protein ACRDTQ_19960 [Micromonosporaceae bacterium]
MPLEEPSDDGKIHVVEKGFSTTTDGSGGNMITFGILFENTSKFVAHPAEIRLNMLDASGERIDVEKWELDTSVPTIMPGQRFGIGGDVYNSGKTKLAKLGVTVEETKWWPLDNYAIEFEDITADNVRVKGSDRDASGAVSFTIHSPYDEPMGGVAFAIFRDHSGRIVGGTDEGDWVDTKYPPGTSRGKIKVDHRMPPKLDGSRTEVYVAP